MKLQKKFRRAVVLCNTNMNTILIKLWGEKNLNWLCYFSYIHSCNRIDFLRKFVYRYSHQGEFLDNAAPAREVRIIIRGTELYFLLIEIYLIDRHRRASTAQVPKGANHEFYWLGTGISSNIGLEAIHWARRGGA